jgi:hypothetical protein
MTALRDHVAALNNSGPAMQAVYRTGAVGQKFSLPVERIVAYWAAYRTVREPGAEANAAPPARTRGGDRYTAEQIEAAARAAVEALHALKPFPFPQPRVSAGRAASHVTNGLRALNAALHAWGALEPFVGLLQVETMRMEPEVTTETPSLSAMPWLGARGVHEELRMAWWLLALGHAAPPVILWHRTPSLHHFRRRHLITVQWFGTPEGA